MRHIYNGLIKALKNMGLSKEDIKGRGLNVHAWRHFCNTEMLKNGIPVKKVQAVTRHKSEPMTDRYTHFNPLEFIEVTNFQAELLKKKPKKPEAITNERPPLTLVKMPETKKANRIVKAS